MPIANVSNQATANAIQLRPCPHPYISAPNAPGCAAQRPAPPALTPRAAINLSQTRQTEGGDVSTGITLVKLPPSGMERDLKQSPRLGAVDIASSRAIKSKRNRSFGGFDL